MLNVFYLGIHILWAYCVCMHTYIVWMQCQFVSTFVTFQRDSLPADSTYAPCWQAGRNVASPGLCCLYPSAGTLSQLQMHITCHVHSHHYHQVFWLLLVSWRLSICGVIASPHVLFFPYYAVQGLYMGIQHTIKTGERKKHNCALDWVFNVIGTSATEDYVFL